MSEAELHIMRARLDQGRCNKAGRGELGFNIPAATSRPAGEICLDPDERVREIIRLVFDVFERRGSVHGVMRYLVDHDIALPDRARSGPAAGEVVWHRRIAAASSTCSPTRPMPAPTRSVGACRRGRISVCTGGTPAAKP